MHQADGTDENTLPLDHSDPALGTLMGALAELDVLATVDDPHRRIAAAQLADGQHDEGFEDLRHSRMGKRHRS